MDRCRNSLLSATLLLALFAICVVPAPVMAKDVKTDSFTEMQKGFEKFVADAKSAATKVVNYAEYQSFVDILYNFFALLLLVFTMARFMQNGVNVSDVMNLVISLLMVKLLMTEYVPITNALWDWSMGFGGAIQKAAVNSDSLYAPAAFIWKLMVGVIFDGHWYDYVISANWMAAAVFTLLAGVLVMMAVVTTVWGLWGFALAKMVGLMFVPTLLFRNLSFLFDGWLRFFFGFLLYSVLARANLSLLALSMAAMFDVKVLDVNPGTFSVSGASVFELMGLFAFMFIGIFSLFSTGRFVASLIGGSSMGIGDVLSGASRGVTRLIMMSR